MKQKVIVLALLQVVSCFNIALEKKLSVIEYPYRSQEQETSNFFGNGLVFQYGRNNSFKYVMSLYNLLHCAATSTS